MQLNNTTLNPKSIMSYSQVPTYQYLFNRKIDQPFPQRENTQVKDSASRNKPVGISMESVVSRSKNPKSLQHKSPTCGWITCFDQQSYAPNRYELVSAHGPACSCLNCISRYGSKANSSGRQVTNTDSLTNDVFLKHKNSYSSSAD